MPSELAEKLSVASPAPTRLLLQPAAHIEVGPLWGSPLSGSRGDSARGSPLGRYGLWAAIPGAAEYL